MGLHGEFFRLAGISLCVREILDNERGFFAFCAVPAPTIAPPDEWIEMTRPDFAFADVDGDRLDASPRYWDPATECTVVYARPSTEPELWSDFIAGAAHSYQQHGIGAAIDTDAYTVGTTPPYSPRASISRVELSVDCVQRDPMGR